MNNCSALWLFLCIAAGSGSAIAADPYDGLLLRNGIKPDVAGIRKYLHLLQPTAAQKREAESLVSKLGDVKYQVRERATQQLIKLPHPPTAVLKRASTGSDPEIRWRAKSVLKSHASRSTPIMHTIMRVIRRKKLTGLTPEILSAMSQVDRPVGFDLAVAALRASSTKKDVPLLTKSLKHKDPDTRAAVVRVLPDVGGDKALSILRPFLNTKESSAAVRIAAAVAFAKAGKRDSISPLIELLSADDVMVRTEAAVTLRALTNKQLLYAAYDTKENRAKAIARWKTWRDGPGKSAALIHPLKLRVGSRSYLHGNLLLAYGYRNKVAEFNAAGKEIWSYTANGAYGAEKLPNGNVLIACYAQKEVLEVTPAKKVVWKMKVPSSLNARPLPNGNILIACHTAKQIWEVNRDKKVIWKYEHTGNCYDAHRLPNGNTMFSSDNGVFEVTPNGKTVWSNTAVGRCYGFQPLPNGNILIAAYGKREVVEITRKKTVVWKHTVSNPFDVQRLINGNTLITASSLFIEVDVKGKEMWRRTGNSYGRARK